MAEPEAAATRAGEGLHGLALLASLPRARGALTPMRPLDELTWLRVGGPAEVLFQPEDADDLSQFLAALAPDIPVTVLGVGSNLIVRDGGVPGVSIRLGRGFNALRREGETGLRAGAALLDAQLAKAAASYGISGLEFLRTIPGAVGGAVRMNAGCYGAYVADVFTGAVAIDRKGRRVALAPEDMAFGYRDCGLPDDLIFIEAGFDGRPDAPEAILDRMEALLKRRAESQPVRERTAGSTFRNPAGFSSTGHADDTHEMKAWKLIDDAGCRGMTLGGARMSPMHPNFLVNTGDATAADLENLGEIVRGKVLETTGVQLVWEVKRIGIPLTT
ncbi:UDP-N-acetylmuramate dehydrogenase [Rubrimonas cliftonensis]|uniref:UDP-N-acetylenolpyruvoylglucosamine reductase n=1 Tax=Rubrimonas cliftonensis TaxID=89524 RepID=A0A1H4B6U2_9RHOB|nr:UDP-N-acetylmuramate dehydrogenase [Rubrimonas cliftonensis]SEA43827.1 UDP-N-acetylmuramate dehydrogenase [Rubrimonas cliftonensis]